MLPPSARNRPSTDTLMVTMLAILTLVVMAYSAYRIQASDRRWEQFTRYVESRDARWERYIERTDAGLKGIAERLSRMEARP